MRTPKGFFIIYQPKYRTPSVFDLNARGVFKTRPRLSQDWGFRIVANDAHEVAMQFVHLVEHQQTDRKTGQLYMCKVVNEQIPLDGELSPEADLLAEKVADETIHKELLEEFHQWQNDYLPLDKKGNIDPDKLREKITASVEEAKAEFCRALVRKNDSWVRSAMPFLIQRFQRGTFQQVGDDLVDEYIRRGGEDDVKGLVQKIMFFYRVLENCNDPALVKPDGRRWCDEEEIWYTWVGYAGSEDEAKRICRSLDTAMVPLSKNLEN